MTEDEMVGWHHRLDRREFEQALGVGDGQGSLVLQSMGSQRVGHGLVTEHNNNVMLGSVLISFFYMKLSRFPSTIY